MTENIVYLIIGFLSGFIIMGYIWGCVKGNAKRNEKTKVITLIESLEKIYENNNDNFYHKVETTSKSIDLYNKLEKDIIGAIRAAPFLGSEVEIFEIELLRDWERIEVKLLEIIARLKKEHKII